MKHVFTVSRTPAVAAVPMSSLEIKLNGVLDIIDRLLLAQRQAPWKTPFPVDFEPNTTTTTTTNTLI